MYKVYKIFSERQHSLSKLVPEAKFSLDSNQRILWISALRYIKNNIFYGNSCNAVGPNIGVLKKYSLLSILPCLENMSRSSASVGFELEYLTKTLVVPVDIFLKYKIKIQNTYSNINLTVINDV